MENSIIHGTELKIGTGHLLIRLQRTQKRLLINVSDDGVGTEENALEQLNNRLRKGGIAGSQLKEESQGGVALANVDNRIRLLFGEGYGLDFMFILWWVWGPRWRLPCLASSTTGT